MNFRLRFAPPDIAISKTGAAADNRDVFPTLAGARAELLYRIDQAIIALKVTKIVAKVPERDLPVEKPEAERGEDRPR